MRHIKTFIIALSLLQFTGCGSDSTNPGSPFSTTNSTSSALSSNNPVAAATGAVLSYNLTLSLTPTSGSGSTVGPNSTVIATATLLDSDKKPVANQPVTFQAIEGPVTIDPITVTTDSSGKAVNFLKAGSTTTSAIDVIVKASASVNNQNVTAIGIFKIMRSESNIIKFVTTKEPTDPDGTLNRVVVSMKEIPTPALPRELLQLVPFQVLDNNGVPRTRVPVKISVYSEIGGCPVYIDSPETTQRTVTTDDTGMGIFNVGVTVAMPEIGTANACSVIYKAEAADTNNPSGTIYSYGGFLAILQNLRTGQASAY